LLARRRECRTGAIALLPLVVALMRLCLPYHFIYTFDAGRFTYANQPLLDLWQKPFAEVVGKNF